MKKIKVKAAMPGNPSFYEMGLQDYSKEALKKLKDHGINTVFINLAWSRPHIDVVCLEHFAMSKKYPLMSDKTEVEANRKKLSERLHNVKEMDMKAMVLVGIPMYTDYNQLPESYQVLKGASVSTISEASVTCISSPEVMKHYKELLDDMFENLGDLDGMLVYTYDELAEICDEESDCPRCHGIPQEVRISKFLNELYSYTQEKKRQFELWWEPWELTWSQVYGTLEQLDKNITVSCHSTLHEVYFANNPDLWLRSMASLCKEQGRNLIVELFMGGTGEDTGFTPSYPCPRLVFEQIDRAVRLEGVTGIKEYYGLCPEYMSINEAVMKETLEGSQDINLVLEQMAAKYSSQGKEHLLQFWELGSRVLELFPWELSWVMRQYNYHPYDTSYWGKVDFFEMMRTPWKTPSWQANRRSYYMVSEDTSSISNTYRKDLIKRFDYVIDLMERSLLELTKVTVNQEFENDIMRQRESIQLFMMFTKCRKNHLNLSLAQKKLIVEEGNRDNLREILNEEKENATQMLHLLENSKLHYILDTKIIREGLKEIVRMEVSIK